MSTLKIGAAAFTALAVVSLAVPRTAESQPAIALAAYSAPGTEGLTPALAAAYTAAYQQARRDGVPLRITSGRRSWAEQEQLWKQGIAKYGSAAAARRWVLPPSESTRVTGHAIDVGPAAGGKWLAANGSRWGLCRAYANEWWHFELLTTPGGTCPPPLPDASER
ncbi:M15 family metallopeptidase [Tsukamurella soli]|uniref:M15 family metallopeptidase n=1 Tax=Tsukamurella soli TaxID=644556 RepID=UPI003619E464